MARRDTELLAAAARALGEAKAMAATPSASRKRSTIRTQAAAASTSRRTRDRRRHEGPLHEAALRGRRALRPLPERADRHRRRGARHHPTQGSSTTSARSASPTRSCASRGPDARGVRHRRAACRARRLIVRDLPEISRARRPPPSPRALGRDGYLDGLAGEVIPLIARILGSPTRFGHDDHAPYRRTLPLREALHRLEDAAATQLDPTGHRLRDRHRDGAGRSSAATATAPAAVDARRARRLTVSGRRSASPHAHGSSSRHSPAGHGGPARTGLRSGAALAGLRSPR